MTPERELEQAMDESFPEGTAYVDLEGAGGIMGTLVCACGDQYYFHTATPGERIRCATCDQAYLVGTRLHLLPL